MRGFLLYLLLGLLAVVLRAGFFPLFLPPGLCPDLLLGLIIYLGLSEYMLRAVVIALLLGGIQDSLSSTTLGLYTFIYLAILFLVRLLSEHLNVESPPLLMLLIAAGTLVKSLLLFAGLTLFVDVGPIAHILIAALPQQLLSNLLVSGLLLFLLLRLQPFFGNRSGLAGLAYQGRRHGN